MPHLGLRWDHVIQHGEDMEGVAGEHEEMPDRVAERQPFPGVEDHPSRVAESAVQQQPLRTGVLVTPGTNGLRSPLMAAMPQPREPVSEAFEHALAEERLRSTRNLNLFRFQGLTIFLVLAVLLRVGLPFQQIGPSLALFACYWAAAGATLLASHRSARLARLGGLAIPFIDMPMICLLMLGTIFRLHDAGFHADASRLAYHTPVYYVGVLFLVSLTLEATYVYLAAMVAAGLEILLAYFGEIDRKSTRLNSSH